jgi:4'-phosphopantetheinyl transferase
MRFARSADVLDRFAHSLRLLTTAERRRADALRFSPDRRDFVAAHVLARQCVAEVMGTDPANVTIEQRCATCGAPHGKPTVLGRPGIDVSWSHGGGHVAAVAGVGRLGIDLEPAPGPRRPAAARAALAPAEARWVRAAADPDIAFTRLWVRKEALIKVGALSLGTLPTADLVDPSGELLARWRGIAIASWETSEVVGAVARTEVSPGHRHDR